MIDEPYRWVEAISNRREYIENELATGSPTIGLSFSDGILLLTFGRDRRKIFEIYDRIAIGGIERLRMMAIELASTEGFTRSRADVSLRPMVTYSFSPNVKASVRADLRAAIPEREFCSLKSEGPKKKIFLSVSIMTDRRMQTP